jgi:GNAT superfamily N-acetyltransferase
MSQTETVTYVEMTAPDQLNPSAPVAGLALVEADPFAPLVRDVYRRVGAPYEWNSASRTDEQWEEIRARRTDRQCRLISYDGETAGVVSYDFPEAGEVEIKTFGLLPEFVGRGIGGYSLTLGIRLGWTLAVPVDRVWLHTSTRDHPNALPNYLKRGFRVFRTEERPLV